MDQHPDQDMAFEQPEEYGHDYYGEGHEEGGPAAYDEELQPPVPEPSNSKKLLTNIAIFGGVGAFALIMAYVNFAPVLFPKKGDIPGASAMTTDPSALLNPVPTPVPPPTASSDLQPVPPPSITPPAVIAAANPPPPPASDTVPSAATSSATAAVNQNTTAAAPPAPATDQAAVPAAAPVAPVNTAAVPAVPAAPSPMMPAATAAPAPAADNSANDHTIAEVQKRLDDLEAQHSAQDTAITELKKRLSDDEGRLAAQGAGTPSANVPPSVHHMHKSAVRKTHHAAVKHLARAYHEPAPIAHTAAAMPSVPDWELRAASDGGVAWIARPGENQLHPANIGDTVAGLGRVTAIEQDNGIWVVVGTEGKIRQN